MIIAVDLFMVRQGQTDNYGLHRLVSVAVRSALLVFDAEDREREAFR
jgi:hypothetical protein